MRERATAPSRITSRAVLAVGATALVTVAQALASVGTASAAAEASAATARSMVAAAHTVRAIPRAYRGSDGRIAFVRNGNIFSIKPTVPMATGLKRLTTAGHASGPRWSPNGKLLAFLYRGNLWVMNANGSNKTQITHAAPRFTDARPTWSPNGRYLAYVKTRRHHASGLLTRYDTVTHKFATFTDAANGTVSAITALPAPVAWAWARNAKTNTFGSYIVFEGAGARCGKPVKFCLNAVGFGAQSDYKNGDPSLEFGNSTKTRLTDPDWLPRMPMLATDVLTTVENCAVSPCAHSGFELTIGGSVQLPGAYEAVFNPAAISAGADGAIIAFVQNTAVGRPEIFTAGIPFIQNDWRPVLLTSGTEPDWQPVAPFPPAGPGWPRSGDPVARFR